MAVLPLVSGQIRTGLWFKMSKSGTTIQFLVYLVNLLTDMVEMKLFNELNHK